MTARWRKWLFVLAGAALASALFVLLFTREREPSYQDRSLTQWLMQGWNGNVTTSFTPEARAAIYQMRTNALPFLLKWVHDDSPGHGLILSLKGRVSNLPDAVTPNSLRLWADVDFNAKRATAAALAFDVLGDGAEATIPELTRLMTNPAVTNASQRAVIALTGIGKPAIPALLTHLANTNAPNRRQVPLSFGWFPSLTTNAVYENSFVPLLVLCLRDPDPSMRSLAVMALSGPSKLDRSQAALVATALTNALGPDSPLSTRLTAIVELGEFGTSATTAIPSLSILTADTDGRIRMHATNALLRIAPGALTNAPPR